MPLHKQWVRQVGALLNRGSAVGPRGQGTREMLNQHFTFDSARNLLDVPSRGLNFRFAVAEWIWMALGRSDVESLARYNSVMRQFSDDGMFLAGAYGPHIGAQRRKVVTLLRNDPQTRQAVIEIPRPMNQTKDEPCTLSLQYLQRDGMLNCIVTMRSSDIWLGVPYDVFTFTQLQNCFAGELGLPRGWLALNVGSSHLYDRHRDDAAKMLLIALANLDDPEDADTLRSPALPGWPPAWFDALLNNPKDWWLPEQTQTHPIWLAYAAVLKSRSSEEAREILVGLDAERP